jgi:hypothetical protein
MKCHQKIKRPAIQRPAASQRSTREQRGSHPGSVTKIILARGVISGALLGGNLKERSDELRLPLGIVSG